MLSGRLLACAEYPVTGSCPEPVKSNLRALLFWLYSWNSCWCTQPWNGLGFQKVEAPRFRDNRHMSAVRTGRLYPPENISVLISLRGWFDIRATLQPVGLSQWEIPMTQSGIEPETFQMHQLPPTAPPGAPHDAADRLVQFSSTWNPHFNPSNAKFNPICHLLALLGAHHILHLSRTRV